MASDIEYMRLALRLARRGLGGTSPNPMVGSILVKRGQIIGRGWHRCAGQAHAEIEALRDAERRGHSARGATLYVTLEPCCSHGRTPPCTKAILGAQIRRVVIGTIDPNPKHAGKGLAILRRAGLRVRQNVLAPECASLNESFNFWIVHRRPFVTVKTAMTLDGKIATSSGESKWITSETSRVQAMKLRQGADAILVGINTILADNPSLTFRSTKKGPQSKVLKPLLRIVLDTRARTPPDAKVVSDRFAKFTTIVVGRNAPQKRLQLLARKVPVIVARIRHDRIDLNWLLRKLGAEEVTSLLVEGGGEVNDAFLRAGLAQRVAFFYAPKILGGTNARKAVSGPGARGLEDALELTHVQWRRLGPDLLLTARIKTKS
jgi:diaminohydroxyphosphoribosylaminopyrimidine deaminase/5-amino-6-(5-phosphoribosylamino)uracil reductase